MAYLVTIPATYTDPADINLVVTEEEILAEIQRTLKEEGITPHTIHLIDNITDEEIEIEVADYLTIDQLSLLEVQPIETKDTHEHLIQEPNRSSHHSQNKPRRGFKAKVPSTNDYNYI